MTAVLLMLFVVFCPLVLSESGDDEMRDEEYVTCSSLLFMGQSNQLTCSLSEELLEEVQVATLCMKVNGKNEKCTNATLGPQSFTFHNLGILGIYELQINTTEAFIKKNITLTKIVKIQAPQIKLVTYMEETDECLIWIEHKHDFVKELQFHVKFKGKLATKEIFTPNTNLSIDSEKLGGDGVYNVCVRAKPVEYFDGMWSEWSPKASFTIKTTGRNFQNSRNSMVTVIIIIISVVLMFLIGLGVLQWKTQIKDYMKPNIPHPKATLAQIQKAKEGFPFTFSPEIFSDVFINRVDYVEEKPSSPELQEGLDEHCFCWSGAAGFRPALVCEMDTKAAELLPTEQSHLKIGLLDESDFSEERQRGGSEGVTVLQHKCKDEAYVTMSSLFKTQ